jgi:glycosyltransferase involved in cell wall biosynthesis
MRILNVTQSYAPFFEFGGPPVKVGALSEGLARRGHEVTVLTVDWGLARHALQSLQHGSEQTCSTGIARVQNGVRAIYLPIFLKYRALSWNPSVKRFCRENLGNFDVVHIFGLYDFLGPAVAAACRARKIPYVLEPIGMFVPIVRNLRLKRLYHAALGGNFIRGARAVVATSEQETAELVAGHVPREKIVLRRNGVEVPATLPERGAFRRDRQIAADAKLILFLGRLSEKKSPDLLLQAFAKIVTPQGSREPQLVFAGPDESGMQENLQTMAAELGVASRVQFAGPLFNEAKWSAYRDADIFVLPSQNENFGNTAAEAVAAGTPVIATDRCGIAPLLEGVAGLVVRHDQPALTGAIEQLLNQAQLHAKLKAGCRLATARLDWAGPVAEMERLYQALAGCSPPEAESLPLE